MDLLLEYYIYREESFVSSITKLFKRIDNCNNKQFILAGSLYPNAAHSPNPLSILQKSFKNLKVFSSENHERIPENLKINIIEVDDTKEGSVMKLLMDLIQVNKKQRFTIFSNSVSRCMDIKKALSDSRINSSLMLADMFIEERIEEYSKFNHHNNILISIDIAARGLDYMADHAVLYNLPGSPSSLVNKIGRVGRNGNHGIVTCFLPKKQMEISNYLKPGGLWKDVFAYYSTRTKKKVKFQNILDYDIDEF